MFTEYHLCLENQPLVLKRVVAFITNQVGDNGLPQNLLEPLPYTLKLEKY